MKNLFRFDSSSKDKKPTGAPKMVPNGGGSGIFSTLSRNFLKNDAISGNVDGIIDVVNDFHWTSSPRSSRQDMPIVQLREKRLKVNALQTQLAYYSLVASSNVGKVGGRLSGLLSNSPGATGFLNGLFSAGKSLFGAVSNIGNKILGSGAVELFTGKSPQDFLSGFTGDSASGVLAPYQGLYETEDTKFEYRMPYFSDSAYALSNAYADDDKMMSEGTIGAGIQGVVKKAGNAAYTAAQTTSLSEPGIYIEKPQFYTFGGAGAEIKFSFPLINSGWATFDDVQRNWQLIYMLVYQNRPNRKSRELIDPPCLYDVLIPGVKYMPYAYISQMSVNFIGARRSYYINVPNSKNKTSRIQTIIPDAYKVDITMKCLLSETQNFLYHMLFEKQNTVNVIESSGNIIVDAVLDGFNIGLNSKFKVNESTTQRR